MKKMIISAATLVVVVGGGWYAGNNHFIKTDEKTYIVEKREWGFENTFAGKDDMAKPVVLEALLRAKGAEAQKEIEGALNNVLQ